MPITCPAGCFSDVLLDENVHFLHFEPGCPTHNPQYRDHRAPLLAHSLQPDLDLALIEAASVLSTESPDRLHASLLAALGSGTSGHNLAHAALYTVRADELQPWLDALNVAVARYDGDLPQPHDEPCYRPSGERCDTCDGITAGLVCEALEQVRSLLGPARCADITATQTAETRAA